MGLASLRGWPRCRRGEAGRGLGTTTGAWGGGNTSTEREACQACARCARGKGAWRGKRVRTPTVPPQTAPIGWHGDRLGAVTCGHGAAVLCQEHALGVTAHAPAAGSGIHPLRCLAELRGQWPVSVCCRPTADGPGKSPKRFAVLPDLCDTSSGQRWPSCSFMCTRVLGCAQSRTPRHTTNMLPHRPTPEPLRLRNQPSKPICRSRAPVRAPRAAWPWPHIR